MKTVLFMALGILGVRFLTLWGLSIAREDWRRKTPGPLDYGIGLVVNFLDTLGLGSFATTTSCFKLWGLVKDEEIPGTLNVGLTLAGILEAFIYIAVVDVDPTTLSLMIGAAVLGGRQGRKEAPILDDEAPPDHHVSQAGAVFGVSELVERIVHRAN